MCAAAALVALVVSVQAPASGRLDFKASEGWQPRPSASSMRVAEFVLPRAPGDTDDGELIVYYFGGSGGSVDANIQRWIGQMKRPAGQGEPKRLGRVVNGLKVTEVDVSGTYTAEMRPGSAERHNKANYRMRAAVVETPRGPYFVKLVGPEKTVARWGKAFAAFLESLRFQA
jgi:hypothetical protein